MTHGLTAARRLTLTVAALLLLTTSSITSSVSADSGGAYASLGHAWMTIDSNLRTPSRVSAWAIDEYLASYTPLPALGHAFKAAEAKYSVNALYLLAHAMHETNFGTSYISRAFHNLFGWNAYDKDPTGMAARFQTFAASIDYVAGQVSDLYLSPWGRFYGGAPTLRGMHYYASDPLWGVLIARIANGIVLPTLAGRGVSFDQPVVALASAGQPTTVTVDTNAGMLPEGLEAAYRFVPVAIVEAGSPTGSVPAADPDFRLARGTSHNDRLRLTIDVPARPGRYRLELQIRDSDGAPLTELGVPQIPDTAIRVFGLEAVAYDLAQDADGLVATVTNQGRRAIPASGLAPGGPSGSGVLTVPTTLTAWLVANDGTPVLLGQAPLDHTLKIGGTWTARLPLPDPAMLPAVLVLRLAVGGGPERLGGAPPAAFRLGAVAGAPTSAAGAPAASPSPSEAADPSVTPSPSALAAPTASSDPPATTDTVAQAAGAALTAPASSQPGDPYPGVSPGPDAAPVQLAIGALTPLDVATRMLLYPTWDPTATLAKAGAAAAKASAAAVAGTPVVRLSYLPLVNPRHPGTATIRITNTGNAPLVSSTNPATTDPSADPAGSSAATAPPIGGAVLLVTAVPAWGPASEPISLSIPLLIDIAPGKSVDVAVELPAADVGQSSYLMVSRVVYAGDHAALPATLFWLRSARPGPASPAAVVAPSLSSMTMTRTAAAASMTPSLPTRAAESTRVPSTMTAASTIPVPTQALGPAAPMVAVSLSADSAPASIRFGPSLVVPNSSP